MIDCHQTTVTYFVPKTQSGTREKAFYVVPFASQIRDLLLK